MNNRWLLAVVSFAICVVSSVSQTRADINTGLVAYYPFDGNTNDASGNGNDATPGGNFQYIISGPGGGGIDLIGDGQLTYSGGGYLQLPTFSSALNAGFTLSVWVNDQSPYQSSTLMGESYVNFYKSISGLDYNVSIGISQSNIAFNAGDASANGYLTYSCLLYTSPSPRD